MNPEFGWTKGMIDLIKPIGNTHCSSFTVLIEIQRNSYSVADGEQDFTSQEYEGLFNFTRYDADGTYCANKEKLLQVAIGINFYNFETREYEELSSETYKYGYIAFKTEVFNPYGKRPYMIIGLNEKCGIKEKTEDSFIKSKIFNYKQLAISIRYTHLVMVFG